MRSNIQARLEDFHMVVGRRHPLKAESLVQSVRIARHQLKPPQPLQLRMADDFFDHPLPETAALIRFQHVDVAEIRIRRIVGDDSRESDLLFPMEETKAE